MPVVRLSPVATLRPPGGGEGGVEIPLGIPVPRFQVAPGSAALPGELQPAGRAAKPCGAGSKVFPVLPPEEEQGDAAYLGGDGGPP